VLYEFSTAAKKTTGNIATVVPFTAQLMLIDGNILFLSLLQLAFEHAVHTPFTTLEPSLEDKADGSINNYLGNL